jgi:hypothetical protein
MYETEFEDGTEITSYLATAYAEGFCEGDGASQKDQIKAWSYLCGTRIGYSLQGFFGRTITNLIDQNVMDENGVVNWEVVDELNNN